MPIGPDDDTPPRGTAIPEERPTDPALPAAQVRCFACHGEGMTLRIVEHHPEGGVAKALAEVCITCRGTKTVTRQAWAAFHARSQGR
jgi:hypothetical protein